MTASKNEGVTVLVVEDEVSFVDALRIGLAREGYRVEVAVDGVEALRMFHELRPDVILLDVMLPKISGIEVCRQIRATAGPSSKTPVIMVTAKTSEIDTVVGLEVGADDYISKPYRLRELVARMHAVLRRAPQGTEPEGSDAVGNSIEVEVGDVRLDPASHEVFVRGDPVGFALKEFELLEILMANAGRVLTRDLLIDRVWGPYYSGDTKTLDVHIKRIRSKIETDPSKPERIQTIRGLGYKFVKS